MHDLDALLVLSRFLSTSTFDLAPALLLGYVGLEPGPEFILYFLALLGVVGGALIAILQWPILSLRTYFRRKRGQDGAVPQSVAADPDEMPGGANDDRPVR